LNLQTSIN